MVAIKALEFDAHKASIRLHHHSSRVLRPPYCCCVAGGRAKNTAWAQEALGSGCHSRNLCAKHEVLVADPVKFFVTHDTVGAAFVHSKLDWMEMERWMEVEFWEGRNANPR
jgi:hypothetical protein